MKLMHNQRGNVDIITLPAHLTQVEIPPLETLLADGAGKVIVDCSAVELIDPSGIALLALIYQASRAKGGAVVLLNLKPPLRKFLAFARLDGFFPLFDEESAAVDHFDRSAGGDGPLLAQE